MIFEVKARDIRLRDVIDGTKVTGYSDKCDGMIHIFFVCLGGRKPLVVPVDQLLTVDRALPDSLLYGKKCSLACPAVRLLDYHQGATRIAGECNITKALIYPDGGKSQLCTVDPTNPQHRAMLSQTIQEMERGVGFLKALAQVIYDVLHDDSDPALTRVLEQRKAENEEAMSHTK